MHGAGQVLVDVLHVLREAVEDAPDGSRVEEGQRRAEHLMQASTAMAVEWQSHTLSTRLRWTVSEA